MSGAQVLLEALEDLEEDDFQTLKWYLSQKLVNDRRPIARSHLEKATRIQTVSRVLSSYGPDTAVEVCMDVLTRMNKSNCAQELQQTYAAQKASRPDAAVRPAPGALAHLGALAGPGSLVAPGAPVSLMAQGGSVIVAPTITEGSAGTWNFTIHK